MGVYVVVAFTLGFWGLSLSCRFRGTDEVAWGKGEGPTFKPGRTV